MKVGVTPIASLMTFLLHPSSAMIWSFVCVVNGVCDLRVQGRTSAICRS